MKKGKQQKATSHGDFLKIPIDQIEKNDYNPNEMTDEEFEMLQNNISKVGFLDPILVVPIEGGKYRIIDGEHRFEALQGFVDKIPAIVCDPELFDDTTSKIETVRMNKIRGGFNISKFNALVNDLVKNHEIPFDSIANELGFVDESEFQQLVEEARKQVPREAVREFDRSLRKVENIDQLHKLVERLWMKYGDTLGANFMILDYGGKRNIWVQIKKSSYVKLIVEKFREMLEEGYTVDSCMVALLNSIDILSFIKQNESLLTRVPTGEEDSVDILLEDEDKDEEDGIAE